VLYAALGAGAAFGINGASFVLSAVLLAGLRGPAGVRSTERRGFFVDAMAGLRVLGTDRLLRALGVGQLLAALSAGATSALLVVLAREHLELPPSGYGFLLGAIGVGAALGPLVLTRLVSDPRRPAFVFGPYVVRGVVDLVLATFAALPIALVALAIYGLGTSSGAVTFNSLLQGHTPEHLRGRTSPASTSSGSSAGWPRCWSAACSPPRSAFRPSTTSVAPYSCSRPSSAGRRCAVEAPRPAAHKPWPSLARRSRW
jgi:hypothetical protein